MKVEINTCGCLTITPENDSEGYALRIWMDIFTSQKEGKEKYATIKVLNYEAIKILQQAKEKDH